MTWSRAHIIVGSAIIGAAVYTLHGNATEPVAGTPGTAPMVACTFEDGSGVIGPDRQQVFPCLWNAAEQGNHTGRSFILWSDPYASNSEDPADSAD